MCGVTWHGLGMLVWIIPRIVPPGLNLLIRIVGVLRICDIPGI